MVSLSRKDRAKERNTWRKWVIGSIIILALFLFLIQRCYVSIQKPYWQSIEQATNRALAESQLLTVERTAVFNGDVSYVIIFGKDEEQHDLIVWVSDAEDEIITQDADQGINVQQVRGNVYAHADQASILRIIPGVWRGQLCWEAYYTIDERKGTTHYYDYYNFHTGDLIETLRLSK